MIIKGFKPWALTAIFSGLVHLCFSQGLHRYPVRVYSTNEGLSQSSVYHILKDKNGYVWAGTGDGLNRLSPFSTEVFKHDLRDSVSLWANAIRGLVDDRKGKIWIGTDRGLNFFSLNQKEVSRSIAGRDLPTGTCVPVGVYHGEVIGLEQGKGFFSINPESGKISRWYFFPELFHADGRCLLLHQNLLWAPTLNGKLVQLDLHTGKARFIPLPVQGGHTTIGGLGPVHDQQLYLAADSALYQLDLEEARWKTLASFGGTVLATGLVADRELWVSVWGAGLQRMDLDGLPLERVVQNLKIPGKESLDLSTVYTIKQTKDSLVWLGVEGIGAVSLWPHTSFQWIGKDDPYLPGLINAFTRSVAVLGPEQILLGTYLDGIFHLDINAKKAIALTYPTGVGLDINGILPWGSDTLFASSETGVWMLFSHQGTRYARAEKIRDFTARNLTKVGEYLAIASSEGLYRFRPAGKGPALLVKPGNFIYGQAIPDGVLVASTSGIAAFDASMQLKYEGGGEAAAYRIKSLYYSGESGLWAATENGLLSLDAGTLEIRKHWSTKEGLPDNFVYGVLEAEGQLWGSTNRGLFSLDLARGYVRDFTQKDGLQGNEFNSGCFALLPGGQLLFGGVAGINIFDPEKLKPETWAVDLRLRELWLNDEPANLGYLQKGLKYTERNLSFEWDVLEWSQPDRARLAVRLLGLDTGWIDLGTRKSIRYTALPPGDYQLYAKAGLESGYWGEEVLFVSFSIAPPFYRSWWFILACSVGGALFFGSLIYYSATRRYRRQLAALERQKEMDLLRKRISRDIHDDVGSDLSKIMMLSQQRDKLGEDHFQKLNSLAQKALEGLSEVVWTVNSDYDRLSDMVAWFRSFAYDFFERTDIKVQIESSSPLPDFLIEPDLRRNLLMIFKEALSNIARHSGAALVSIHFGCTPEGLFKLSIADNGKGFCPPKENCGNGLRNMEQRAMATGFSWSLSTSRESGTEIKLEAVLHKKYH